MTSRDSSDDENGIPRDGDDGASNRVPDSGVGDAGRAPFRLSTAVPVPAEVRRSRKVGLALSVAIHTLIFALLVLPVLMSPTARAVLSGGAGGPGAAGGGGGGFGIREALRYIRLSPAPAASAPTPVPPVAPPVQREVPPPTPQPVQPVPTESPPVQSGTADSGATAADAAGSGGPGAGPGTGGGTGSGVGTGRGSAEGPGTGGGTGEDYPPQPLEVFLPPSPIPSKIRRPYTLVVTFDVDSVGRVLKVDFPGTPDGGYNRRLREIFSRMRFRPAVSAEGRPLRRAVTLTYQF